MQILIAFLVALVVLILRTAAVAVVLNVSVIDSSPDAAATALRVDFTSTAAVVAAGFFIGRIYGVVLLLLFLRYVLVFVAIVCYAGGPFLCYSL